MTSTSTPVADRGLVAGAAGLVVVLAALGAMTRVFVDASWAPVTVASATLATVLAAVAHRLRVPAVLSALASAVGLAAFSYLVHLEAPPLLPGAEQLEALRELVATGVVQLRDEPAPTVPLDGLMLVVTSGAWFVAHLVHEVVVRLGRAGLALVAATVLWAVPLAVPLPDGRTWPQTLPFLAAGALLLLVESDADVRTASRDRAGPRVSVGGMAVASVAILAAGLFPAALPGYEEEPWLDVAGGSDPRGYQPIVDIGDRLRLPGERDVLEYTSDRRAYLRLAALDTFDGTTWRLGPADQPTFRPDPAALTRATAALPPEVPLGTTTPLDLDVRVLDLENIYVPVPYQPTRLSGSGASDMVYSDVGGFVATAQLEDNEIGGRLTTGVQPGLEYRVEAAVPSPQPAELRSSDPSPDEVGPWLALPSDYDRYRELAKEVYAAAGAETNVDRALALQEWFIGADSDFTYSTDVAALRGSGALDDFVFSTRAGYCEYFSTAMAVMLRASGVPARVAVGFLGGRVTQEPDAELGETRSTYTVSTGDAHAWTEVLFPGHGWVRFEPTPRTDGQVQVPSAGDLTPDSTAREQAIAGLEDVPLDNEPVPDFDDLDRVPVPEDAGADAGGAGGDDDGPATWLLALLGLLLVGGAGAWVLARRDEHAETGDDAPDRVLAAQRELLRTAAQLGLRRPEPATLTEALGRWADDGRVERHPASDFAAIAQAAAFGGLVTEGDADRAERLAERLAEELVASVDTRDRLVAPARLPAERALAGARSISTSAAGLARRAVRRERETV